MLLLVVFGLIYAPLGLAIIFLTVSERLIHTKLLLHLLLLAWIWTMALESVLLLLVVKATAAEINVPSSLKEKLLIHTYPESFRVYHHRPFGHHANG